MHIREVTIENVRRFGAGTSQLHLTLPEKGWIVVAGPNGSGKTTLLQVLALGISRSFSEEYARTISSFLRLGEKAARSRVIVAGNVDDQFHDAERKAAADEKLILGHTWKAISARDTSHRPISGDAPYFGPWHDNPRGWFAAGYGAYRGILSGAVVHESWVSGSTRESAFLTLFNESAMLGHPIRWLMDLKFRSIGSDDPNERDRASKLGNLIIAILNADLLGEVEVLGAKPSGLSVKDDGIVLSINRLGNGIRALAAIVIDIIRHMEARFGELKVAYDGEGKPRIANSGVVLIDEVEQHLHPQWQRQIGFWFQKHFPNIQFIVTTHSPFVCQAATEKGLILLSGDSGQPAIIADEHLYYQVVNGSVDDALLSGLFGLDRTWSDESEKQREHLAQLETKVLTGHAAPEERTEYKQLRKTIPQSIGDEADRITERILQRLDKRQ